MKRHRQGALLIAAALVPFAAHSEDAKPAAKLAAISLEDLGGTKHALPLAKTTVFLFLGVECPATSRYVGRIAELTSAFGQKATFLGVNPNALESIDAIREDAKSKAFAFPMLLDRDQKLADALGVTTVPACVVVDAEGVVRYRGAIDDNKNPELAHHKWAHDAIAAVVEGKPVPSSETKVTGCLIQRAPREREATVTWAQHVAPILQQNCVGCHRPGQVAPFSLVTYEQARRWAQDLKRTTETRTMPPWKPVNHELFRDARWLTNEEIATIGKWADAGAPAGDLASAPPTPAFAEGWALGEPDLTLTADEYTLPATGPDEYRCYVLSPNIDEDKWVASVEIQPGNRSVVHHVLTYIDVSGRAEQLDAADPLPGFKSKGTGPGFQPVGEMGGWAPGIQPQSLPEGVGRWLPKGAKLILEVHYHKNGKVEKDRTRIGLHYSKVKVRKPLEWFEMINHRFRIPAGKESHSVRMVQKVTDDVHLLGVAPHMHLLGRGARVEAVKPDGSRLLLIEITDWDFNWQDYYFFKQQIFLPKGSRIEATFNYDNSTKNPNNPSDPPREVGWGDATTDEMCLLYVGFVRGSEFR